MIDNNYEPEKIGMDVNILLKTYLILLKKQ